MTTLITRHYVRSQNATRAVCGSTSELVTLSPTETTCTACLRVLHPGRYEDTSGEPTEPKPPRRGRSKPARSEA